VQLQLRVFFFDFYTKECLVALVMFTYCLTLCGFWFCQEPITTETSHTPVHDVPSSAVAEPNIAPPRSASTADEVTIDEHVAVSVPDVAVATSTADTLAQSLGEEKSVTESTGEVKPAEPVFASTAGVKPKPEVKNDLSSMFKSLSAKMKQQRQSRFSDISPADLLSDAVTATCLSSTVSDSSHLFFTLVDRGLSRTDRDSLGSISLQSSSVMQSMPLTVSNRSAASAFSYDMHHIARDSQLLSADQVSVVPTFSQPQHASMLSQHGDIEVGPEVTYKAGASKPSTERRIFSDSPYVVPQSTFHGPLPSVSLQPGLPGHCGTSFGGPMAARSVHSAFVGLAPSHEMLPTMSRPMHFPQSQLTEQQKELCELQAYSSVALISDSVYTQQGLPRPPAPLVNVFPGAQPQPVLHGDPAPLGSSRLYLDQQPVRLFLPHPPRPPIGLASGQPSSLPVAVRAPLNLVQESPAMEQLQPWPELAPVPTQFMMEPAHMPVPMHQVPHAGLATEQSAVQSSPVVEVIPSFLPDPPLQRPLPSYQRPLAPQLLLQQAPNRLPSMVHMPTPVQAGEIRLGPQHAVRDAPPGPIRLPLMPQSLVDSDHHSVVGQQLPAPQLAPEFPEVQPILQPRNNVNLTDQPSDQLSAGFLEFPGSRMLPDRGAETWQPSDRQQVGISSRPLMAPGQVLGSQHAVPDAAPGQIRLPLMPQSLVDSDRHPIGQQLPAPQVASDFQEVQPILEPQSNVGLTAQPSDQLSSDLHSSEYLGSRMLPDQGTETQQQSDRQQFGVSSRPLVAPGQVLEERQGPPVPQSRQLLGEPSKEALLAGMKPLQVSDIRSEELGRVPDISQPVVEHDDCEYLEQRGPLFSSCTFSSRLPAPAVVMASSSQFPGGRFQPRFRHHDFADELESGSSLDHPVSTSVDRIGPSGHLSEFAATSTSTSFQHFAPPERPHVPSLLDDNVLEMSSRRWKDRSGSGEIMTVGQLRESLRQHADMSRRRRFHHFSDDDVVLPESSYEPPNTKFMKYTVDDTDSESNNVPETSDNKSSDSDDDKDTESPSIDEACTVVAPIDDW